MPVNIKNKIPDESMRREVSVAIFSLFEADPHHWEVVLTPISIDTWEISAKSRNQRMSKTLSRSLGQHSPAYISLVLQSELQRTLPSEQSGMAWIAREQDAGNIRFLYDKRLSHFDTRRDHEWKIFFASVVFLGAVDAGIVTNGIVLPIPLRWLWAGICLATFVVVCGYEMNLQVANRYDRRAMNLLFNMLCDCIRIDTCSAIRERHRQDGANLLWGLRWWRDYGWAFRWQVIFLALLVMISATIIPQGAFNTAQKSISFQPVTNSPPIPITMHISDQTVADLSKLLETRENAALATAGRIHGPTRGSVRHERISRQ